MIYKEIGLNEEIFYNKDKIEQIKKISTKYQYYKLESLSKKICKAKELINYNLNFRILFADVLITSL